MGTLKSSESTVWFTLYRAVSPQGVAECSHTYIRNRTGLSTRTITRAIDRLSELGLVERIYGGWEGAISRYLVRGTVCRTPSAQG